MKFKRIKRTVSTLAFLAIVNPVFSQDEVSCDDFTSPDWVGIEGGDTMGYTQEGLFAIEKIDAIWSDFNPGGGYLVGALKFNFDGSDQTATFTLTNATGCEWDTQMIKINGSTEVGLGESFPVTVDGYTISSLELPDGEFDEEIMELSISGDLTSIEIHGCETSILDLCIVSNSITGLFCDDFTGPDWVSVEEGDTMGYTQEGLFAIEKVDDIWSEFGLGGGYLVGALKFNFDGSDQKATFTLTNATGCEWDTQMIKINGSTEVGLGESFPLTVDGYTVTWIDLPDGEWGEEVIKLSIEGSISAIEVHGCETSILKLCVESGSVGIDKNEKVPNVIIYPNPASTTLTLVGSNETLNYSIYSLSGEVLFQGQLQMNNPELISVIDLAEGLYIVELEGVSGTREMHKFIKN